jgi:hypothetical protein
MNKDFKLVNINIKVNLNDLELFKKICKLNRSNTSVEIRRFIKDYIVDNSDKVLEPIKKGE